MLSRMSLFGLIIYASLLLCLSIEIIEAKRQTANTRQFDKIVVFGGSFSDNGNSWRLSNYTFPPQKYYYRGRFTNGLTWIEYLADFFHAKDENYAYAAATADANFVQGYYDNNINLPLPGIKQEINNMFLTQVKPESVNFDKTLFVVQYQGNDYFDAAVLPWDVINILYEQWVTLVNFGAKHILIYKLLNIEHLPIAVETHNATYFKLISNVHNSVLDLAILRFRQKYENVSLYILPMNKVWEDFQQPSLRKKLGITDLSNPCVIHNGNTTVYTECSNTGQHFFWDSIHPSTKVHRYIGATAYKIITGTENN